MAYYRFLRNFLMRRFLLPTLRRRRGLNAMAPSISTLNESGDYAGASVFRKPTE